MASIDIVDIDDVRKDLSRLIECAASGESFIIAKDGKPMARVTGMHSPQKRARLGFLAGEITVPEDFNQMGQAASEELFAQSRALCVCR